MSVFGVILVRIFPAFSHIRTECGEIQIISPYSVRILENAGKWTLLTQCIYFPWKVYFHYDKVLYRILKISYLVLFSLLLSLLTDFVFVTDHALGRCLNIHIRAPIKLVVSVLEFCRKCILILLMF